MQALIGHENRGGAPNFAKFPVIFPVSRDGAETGSQLTASSASKSGLHELTYGYRLNLVAPRRFADMAWSPCAESGGGGAHSGLLSPRPFFWRLVFDRALKTLGWFSCKTRRYSCV